MASASSSTTSTMMADSSRYDVFLSFRGLDTRNSFTDHLYDKLVRAGIKTFRDDDEIDGGEELKPEIEKAIKASDASIIVLSENYATSTWCLDELSLIIEQWEETMHQYHVLPVFYHVDPSDVRQQKKGFHIESKTSSSRWTDDNVNRWKTALTKVVDLKGFVCSGLETQFLKKIVDTIYHKLDRKRFYLPPNLTGIDARVQEINHWMKESDAQFLVIYGMGGSGKSTLAKYFVYSNQQYFENISIVEHIDSKCQVRDGLFKLREQLLCDVLGGNNRSIRRARRVKSNMEEVLRTKKALIVLDDIVKSTQLEYLLGYGHINAGSKIIITTTENDLGAWFKSTSRRCEGYKMELLNDNESLELLCLRSFGSKIPMEGYEELAKEIVRYCGGIPLALEVLGSSLSEDNSITYWRSFVRLLGNDIHCDIYSVLKRSYDSLPYASDKELFLDIACFFVGKDMDYVVKILEPDYFAVSRIKTLIKRCLVYVTSNKKLMMHRLLQDMGRSVVDRKSSNPRKRSRVWRNKESYQILKDKKGSKTMKGLALDNTSTDFMSTESSCLETDALQKMDNLETDALQKMDNLKFLHLNHVELSGSFGDFPRGLRWLSWIGSGLRTIPSNLYMGNLVALDMSYSMLEIFDPPMVLRSLQHLDLKCSYNLIEIRNIFLIPNLEILILWGCGSLIRVCESIGGLTSLTLLNMTGCELSGKRNQENKLLGLTESTSKARAEQLSFPLPRSLQRLFLNNCLLECSDIFPLDFKVQANLQYLNLGYGLFEWLPCYNHLYNLRVLDLSFCLELKWLLCLPSTLEELYIYHCKSLEMITFESHRFTLQEFGYGGCIHLTEIEGYIKLVPIAKLNDIDLGHLKWLKEYQYHEVCLVGDDELTIGRSCVVQMLYEFDIMSTSLPDLKDPNLKPEYLSESSYLSFDVPSCPKNKVLKGLNLIFKYTMPGHDCAWFAKISSSNKVDLMYNPKVFGKPASGEVATWLSYWPIGSALDAGDKVNISIVVVISGLEVHECGASLVYTDDEEAKETMENNTTWIESIGRDFSGFQLSTGAYYLCHRDLFRLMEAGRLAGDWFRILVGDTIDNTEVRGWRKTGRPKQLHQSFTELKTISCISNPHDTVDFLARMGLYPPRIVSTLNDVSGQARNEAMPMPRIPALAHILYFLYFWATCFFLYYFSRQ